MTIVQSLLTDIEERSRMSDSKIAAAVGCSQPTIWRLRNGKSKTCSSDTYLAIVGLHDQVMAPPDAAPAPEAGPAPEPGLSLTPILEALGAVDPRHGERRSPEKRQHPDRRAGEV